MSREAVLLALQKLGLKPDPTEGELLAARESGKPPPCGDAKRELALFLEISSAVWERRILLRFERKPRPKDVAAELWTLAKACRSSARTLRSLSKSACVLIFHDLDLGDRFFWGLPVALRQQAERLEGSPESLSRLRTQFVGREQELASCFASLAREAAYIGVSQDEHLRWLEGDSRRPPAGADKPLMSFSDAQSKLCAAWRNLSRLAVERLFGAKPLWALSRPEGTFESNPAFWRALGPPGAAACKDVELTRRWLLEKMLAVAQHADATRLTFVAAWPQDNGGVSPLVGSANSRLSDALLPLLVDMLPESHDRISGRRGDAYDQLLLAVSAMADEPDRRLVAAIMNPRDTLGPETYDRILQDAAEARERDPYERVLQACWLKVAGEKPKKNAFANVLEEIPARLAELLNRPGPKAIRELAVAARTEADARRKDVRDKADTDRYFKRLRDEPEESERRRLLHSISSRDPVRGALLRMALNEGAEQLPPKTWVPPLRPIRRG